MARILLADDAAFMRLMLRKILEEVGHEIVGEAVNGNDAIEKCRELSPDILTLDITMPECDGLEAIKKIHVACPQVNVIMCSAMGQQAMVIDAIQSGAKDFIVKPFDNKRVIEAVNKALQPR